MASFKGIDLAHSSKLDGSTLRIGIVHTRWNTRVVEALLKGACDKLVHSGVKPENLIVQSVPGSYELPLACKK